MRYSTLKTTAGDLRCSAFAYGADVFGGDRLPFSHMCKILDTYIEAGGNVIDTARIYGRSEEHLGEWLMLDPSMRRRIIIASKGGQRWDGRVVVALREEEVYDDLCRSLAYLHTDSIDIYFLHKDDESIPVETIVTYMNKFLRQGLIRVWGVSNWSVSRINAANAFARQAGLCGIEISQIAFSPYVGTTRGWGPRERCIEMTADDYEGYRQNHIPVMAYNAQARGFFYTNFDQPDGDIDVDDANRRKLHVLREICRRDGLTPQQAVFGFFAGLDVQTIPIASTANIQHLRDMLAGCDVVLDREDVTKLLL